MNPAWTRAFCVSLIGSALAGACSAGPAIRVESSAASATKFLATEGGQVAYEDTGGPGPVVVAIPGMGDQRSEYRFLRERLVREGFRVVTIDVRGMGESTAKWSDYTAHAVARDTLALLRELNTSSATIIGTSFAAGACLWLVHDAPDRAAQLVLISPFLRDYPRSFLQEAMLDVGFAGPWRVRFWLAYWDSLFPSRTPPDQPTIRSSLAGNLRQPGRMEALEKMVRLSKSDTARLLSLQPVRTLVIAGTKDRDFDDPPAEARKLADQLGARVALIEGAGHYPQAEVPGETGDVIVEFLRSR